MPEVPLLQAIWSVANDKTAVELFFAQLPESHIFPYQYTGVPYQQLIVMFPVTATVPLVQTVSDEVNV